MIWKQLQNLRTAAMGCIKWRSTTNEEHSLEREYTDVIDNIWLKTKPQGGRYFKESLAELIMNLFELKRNG
jgi:hypothetical protein